MCGRCWLGDYGLRLAWGGGSGLPGWRLVFGFLIVGGPELAIPIKHESQSNQQQD
jgi:hypothetical protein